MFQVKRMSTMDTEVDCFPTKRMRKNPDASSTSADLPTDILSSIFKTLELTDIIPARAVCSSSWNPDASSSTFADLPNDILRSIVERLDLTDIIRARAVCSSWNTLGKEFVNPNTPWLMLPSREEVETGDGTEANNNAYSGFLKLGENQACSLKKIPKEFRECCCIGSSNGWLIFLGEKAVPFLFHPFKQVKTELPSMYGLLRNLCRMERTAEGQFQVEYVHRSGDFYDKQKLRDYFIRKAILTTEPDCNKGKYIVILLCNDGKLAYHKSGDNCWIEVPNSLDQTYQDIICYKNHLLALCEGAAFAIWNFCEGGFTEKRMCDPIFPVKLSDEAKPLRDLCTLRFYLVESCGDILLVVRFVGEFVNSDGNLVHEGDSDMVCSYKTWLFHVYKLDFCESQSKWVEIESLGDRALFVGGNLSVSVSTRSLPNCKANSIYYTDDYWERMEEDYSYGGHDTGVYDLKKRTVEPIYQYSSEQILPPACWIIPTSLL